MKYYKRVDTNGKTTTVEAYSHDSPVKDAEPITQGEFESYLATLPQPPPPPDKTTTLEARVKALEDKVKGV